MVSVILYKLILDITYYFLEYKVFSYTGFDFHFSLLKYVLCWILYLVSYNLIKTKKNDICSVFVYITFALSITPFLVFYQFSSKCKLWMLVVQLLCLLLIKWVFFLFPSYWRLPFEKINYCFPSLRRCVRVILIVYLMYTMFKFGLPRMDLMFSSDISIIRAEVSLSTLDNIIQTIICKIVCPLVIVVSFKEKKWTAFVFSAFIQVYTYGVTGFKTYLFIPLVFFAILFFENLKIKKIIFGGLTAMFCGLNLWSFFSKDIYLYALLGDRVVFFPAIIKYSYFDFFSKHDFANFSQSTLAGIFGVKSNYFENIPNMIGRIYFDMPEMWTNTGFMADGYSNAGILGMLSMSLLIAVVLSLIRNEMHSSSSGLSKCLEALLITYAIALNDGPAISTLFSGGLIFVLLVVSTISFENNSKVQFD